MSLIFSACSGKYFFPEEALLNREVFGGLHGLIRVFDSILNANGYSTFICAFLIMGKVVDTCESLLC